MDVRFFKIDKVDLVYYKFLKRIDILEEIKIKGVKEEVDEYFGSFMDGMLLCFLI